MLQPWDPLGYKVSHFRQARRLPLASSQLVGPLWEFRWGATTGICYVTRITLKGVQIGAAATPAELRYNLTFARGFTAVDTTNTASILRSGNMQKLNTAFSASLLTAFRESNSATAPTGGTYTQDTDPLAIGAYSTVATPTVDGATDTIFDFQENADGDQPLRLNTNEGFIINLEASTSGQSNFTQFLEVCWIEATKAPTP